MGTDRPHVNLDGRNIPNDGHLVDPMPEWIADGAARRQILVDDPCKLCGFPPLCRGSDR